MRFVALVFFVFQSFLWSCTVCTNEVPQVNVTADVTSQKEKTVFEVQWRFHKQFVDNLTQYDINENQKFEINEKLLIQDSLESYLKEYHYLTDIEYKHQKKYTKTKYVENIKILSSKLLFDDKGMEFQYTFELPITLKNSYKLYLGFNDERGNFNFIFKNMSLDDYPHSYTLNKGFYFAEILFSDPNIIEKKEIKPTENENNIISKEIEQEKKQESILSILEKKLTQIKNNLKKILKDIKENNNITSYLWLLFFSFLYGIIHAIGPGHGKSLVSSYFLQQDKSYLKAFSVASLIAIVHTFSAFLLTLIIYTSVGFIFNSTLVDVEKVTTKISAVIIIIIALYLLWQKYKQRQKPVKFVAATITTNKLSPKVTHTNTLSCACNSCKTTSTDLGVILAAGIIPCPGTVTVFLFTISLGIYFVGFVSALFMSIGMSLVIFITAILSITIRHTATKNTTLIRLLEYGSLFFILMLGVILIVI